MQHIHKPSVNTSKSTFHDAFVFYFECSGYTQALLVYWTCYNFFSRVVNFQGDPECSCFMKASQEREIQAWDLGIYQTLSSLEVIIVIPNNKNLNNKKYQYWSPSFFLCKAPNMKKKEKSEEEIFHLTSNINMLKAFIYQKIKTWPNTDLHWEWGTSQNIPIAFSNI